MNYTFNSITYVQILSLANKTVFNLFIQSGLKAILWEFMKQNGPCLV